MDSWTCLFGTLDRYPYADHGPSGFRRTWPTRPSSSRKVAPGTLRCMNTTNNGRDARTDAARRLRNLTIGTAVLGVVATGGLAALAATTNAGSDVSVTAVVTTAAGATATAAPIPTTTTTTTTTTSVPVVTAVTGPGNASTGGS
jgi:hypothetical protein